MKILITSCGSLVARNIHDALESRRHLIELVGVNSVADHPLVYQFDRAFLVPETADPDYDERFLEILDQEQPDLILPGRDADVIKLSKLAGLYPDLAGKVPQGSPVVAEMMLDKVRSAEFAARRNLPFANTLFLGGGLQDSAIEHFLASNSFPLVVKPIEGFGSHGVYFIENREQLYRHIQQGDCILQEYLEIPDEYPALRDLDQLGLPLFQQVPEKTQVAVQSILKPDGTLAGVMITNNTNVMGRTEYTEHLDAPELQGLMETYGGALYEAGWFGSVNLQVKRDMNGTWKVFEMNPRMTGSTSARLRLGFDEIGMLISVFRPEFNFPVLNSPFVYGDCVIRTLRDDLLRKSDRENLQSNRTWSGGRQR